MSVPYATINPTQQKEEKMDISTASSVLDIRESMKQEMELLYGNEITELKNQLSTHTNCDYWKSENGRIGSQLIDLINDSYENDTDAKEILEAICEIIDYEAKREVSFIATIRIEGRADIPYGEHISDYLNNVEFNVDTWNGDVVIDNTYPEDVEEA